MALIGMKSVKIVYCFIVSEVKKMKNLILFVMMCLFFLPTFAMADEIDLSDFSPEPPVVQGPSQPVLVDERVGQLETADIQSKIQNFDFSTAVIVDPVAVVEQGKYGDLKGKVIWCLSIRRSKMSKKGAEDGKVHANDLQIDCFWGDFLKRTHLRNNRIVYNWCDNQIISLLMNQDIHLKIKSEYITQIREICREYLQECQPPCEEKPVICKPRFRRPGVVAASEAPRSEFRYKEGILQIVLGAIWTPPSKTNVNNSTCIDNKNVNTNNNGLVSNNVNNLSQSQAN